jgi:hypothetical protein
MAPNAQIQNIPIESIERNQFETNYGEGRETIKRHFNNFEHYMQIRQIEIARNSIPYYDEAIQIENHIHHSPFDEQNRFAIDTMIAANVISIVIIHNNQVLHTDNSHNSMPILIPIVEELRFIPSTNRITEILVERYLTATNLKHVLGLVAFHRKHFPQIANNLIQFINNPYPYLDHKILNRQILDKLNARSKKLQRLYIKAKRPKQPVDNSSSKLKLVNFHIRRAHLQRKGKHTSR